LPLILIPFYITANLLSTQGIRGIWTTYFESTSFSRVQVLQSGPDSNRISNHIGFGNHPSLRPPDYVSLVIYMSWINRIDPISVWVDYQSIGSL